MVSRNNLVRGHCDVRYMDGQDLGGSNGVGESARLSEANLIGA